MFINEVPAEIISILDNQIIIVVPQGASTGKIKVSTGSTSTVTADDFTVLFQPEITEFTPDKGALGTEVVISGSNFTPGSTVFFNGVSGTVLSIQPSSIKAIVPNGSWPGKIQVTAAGGTVESSAIFAANPPVISLAPRYAVDRNAPFVVLHRCKRLQYRYNPLLLQSNK